MNKREFIKSAAVIAGAAAVKPLSSAVTTPTSMAVVNEKNSTNLVQGMTLKKSLGFGMINEELSLADKFKLARDLGFDGIELNTPSEFTIHEVLEAKEASGIELPSVVNKGHWSSPLSDPDPAVRKNASIPWPDPYRKSKRWVETRYWWCLAS